MVFRFCFVARLYAKPATIGFMVISPKWPLVDRRSIVFVIAYCQVYGPRVLTPSVYSTMPIYRAKGHDEGGPQRLDESIDLEVKA
jgi:hypothetical protein